MLKKILLSTVVYLLVLGALSFTSIGENSKGENRWGVTAAFANDR